MPMNRCTKNAIWSFFFIAIYSLNSLHITYPALKVHFSTETDQRLDAFHLRDAVITLLNQLEKKRDGEMFVVKHSKISTCFHQ